MAVNVGADILGDLAFEKVRRADGELDDFEPAGNFTERVVMGLAVLRRDRRGEAIGVLL